MQNLSVQDVGITIANSLPTGKWDQVIGIKRGGCIPAMILANQLNLPVSFIEPNEIPKFSKHIKNLIVDDICDTGATIKPYLEAGLDVYCVYTKHKQIEGKSLFYGELIGDEWLYFPWETKNETAGGVEQAITTLLRACGENPLREGLSDTPRRFAKAWSELTKGYEQKAEDFCTVFESDGYDQMVLLKDIEFFSLCEHHLLPFYGKAHVAYIPDGQIIGLSKLARIVDMHARRLQNQERITENVAKELDRLVKNKGVAVCIEASHLCMRARGVQKQNSVMRTSKLLGAFMDKPEARNEFFAGIV